MPAVENLDDVMLDMEEAAALARTTLDGVRAFIRRHRIPTTKYSGVRRVFVRRGDLLTILKRQAVR
jgi:hypothetical protein